MKLEPAMFKELQKQSGKSFNNQKALIKKLMSGKVVSCECCGSPLTLTTPDNGESTGIHCKKGCTDIELDFS